ncbi:MAG TPA: SDR family oxidoreductase [Kribbella sp.]
MGYRRGHSRRSGAGPSTDGFRLLHGSLFAATQLEEADVQGSTRIEGSVALVTGANRGIGRAITEALLERGAAKVYATARDPKTLEVLRERYGPRVVALRLDVTDVDQVAEVAREATDVDVLFNNAGAFEPTDLTNDAIVDAARREMEVNYFGALRMLRGFGDTLVRRGGTIVNVGSAAGLTNVPLQPTYSASKAAQHSLTQASRALLAAQGVRVHGVYPGPVDTDMTKDLPPQFEKTPPEDVANKILDGVQAGYEDIFPDPFAVAFGEQFHSSPKAVERQMAAIVAIPA